ncbi:MAG: alpha-2-macroglobulin family protein, partial [Pseudothermotoga sp.]
MYKRLSIALSLFAASLFAGYGYFMNDVVLEIPNDTISFSVSDMDRVVLSVYELNEDPLTFFLKRDHSYDEIKEKIGKRAYQKSFQVTARWQNFSVDFKRVGLYYAVLTNRDQTMLLDSAVFLVTDIGVVFSSDGEKTILCAMKTTSELLPQAEVFLTKDGKTFLHAKTDDQGLFETKEDFDTVVIKKDNSYTVSSVYRYSFAEVADRKLFLVTDRPIYKPKDIVNFKGQMLKREGNLYTVLGTTKVEVVVSDPKDNEIYRRSLNTDELGGFWDSFELAETAQIGVYQIRVLQEGREFYESFLVEEYRKPEYKVEIETSKDQYIAGENIQATVRVKYFNEQPVAAANVAFYVRAYPEYGEGESLVFRGYEITNEEGELSIALKTEGAFQGRYSIQVIATDESQRQVEEEKSVLVYADNVKMELEDNFVFAKPGEKVVIKVKVTDLAGTPLSGEMVVKVGDQTKAVNIVAGEGAIDFLPKSIGTFKIELSFGKSKKYLYVYSYSWAYGYTVSEFAMITEKESYKIGEELSAQIFTPQSAVGAVALVGDRIYAVKVVKVDGYGVLKMSIPTEAVERNLFLVFNGYSNGRKVSETKKLKIEKQLNVQKIEIVFDKSVYEPREDARLIIKADDDFSFSLALVDEAIYSMLGRKPISLEEKIYPENEYPGVSWEFAHFWMTWSDSRRYYHLALAREALPTEKSFEDYKAGAVGAKINIREYFPDTALWIPNLKLENGTATVVFKVPDSLTTFLATGYGFSQNKMAQADGKFVVTRDFYVRPILPSFFREGDIVQIGSTVFNQTSEAMKTKVWIELPESVELIPTGLPPINTFTGFPLEDEEIGEFVVQPKGSGSSAWLIKAKKESDPSTVTTFATTSTGLSDAVALNVPVKPFAFEREFYTLEFLSGFKEVKLPEGEYKQARLTVYSSVLPLVEGSIKKLIRYPYGCTEQTMSSFLPAVVAAQMGLNIENLDDIVRKGLMRLYKYQHYDGGWGWWESDKSSDFMTCYVMEGLYYAKKAGFDVAESVIESGLEYLSENPSAYGSYVLSLYEKAHKPYRAAERTDWVYLSLSSRTALQQAISLVKEYENYAFIDVKDDYLITRVQLTSILLR